MDISIKCLMCKSTHTVTVKEEDYKAWEKGEGPKRHAQVAFPYLTPAQRELLISKTCNSCFDRLFPPED